MLLPRWFSGRRWDRPGSRGRGAWGPWTWPWAGFAVLGIRLPGGRSKGRRGCRAHSPARRAAPVQSGGLRGGLGASLPPAEGPECLAPGAHAPVHWFLGQTLQGFRREGWSLSGSCWGVVTAWRLHLCPRGWERPPSPGPRSAPTLLRASPGAPHLPPSPQAAPDLRPAPHAGHPRKPWGGLGSGECSGGRNNTTKQSKRLPPAPSPHPHASLSGPRACLS